MRRKGAGRKGRRNKNRAFLYFLAPSFLGILLLVIFPFFDVIRRSFTTAVTGRFAGTANYRMIFTNQAFLLAVKNTFAFTGFCIPLLVVLGLLAALPLGRSGLGQKIKSLYLFPLVMPTATVVLVWQMVFEKRGFLNRFLSWAAGTGGKFPHGVTVDYLGSGAAFFVLTVTYLWKNLGYTVILWLAGLMSIPEEILEAAQVDGAGKVQRLFYVVFPNLRGSLYTIVVLSFLNSFKIYREAYLVAGAYPNDSIYLLQHLFNNWFVKLELDKMAAGAVTVGVFLFCFILLLQSLWDKRQM